MSDIHSDVQNYYGQELQQSSDLKTDACCSKAQVPEFLRRIIGQIHPDVLAKYYGCGLVFPPKLENCRVVDLGCGAGRDVYILSSLVGSAGFVVGVDMTKEQLDVARQYVDYHTKQFQLDKANVDFRLGKIESLTDENNLETNSFDVVVSNCVVNLSPDKKRVLEQVHQVLKVGGEFYFSDVYSDRTIPDELRQHKVLWGECLSGALRETDLISYALEVGFTRPLLVSRDPIGVNNPELKTLLGDIQFSSCTYRMFKKDSNCCQSCDEALVYYQSPILHNEESFQFDETIVFKFQGKPHLLRGENLQILKLSRYADNFKFLPFDENIERETLNEPSNPCASGSSTSCCC